MESEYRSLFSTIKIQPDREKELTAAVDMLVSNRPRYEAVSNPYNIPWYVVGILHYKESDFSFTLHLVNGDPLTARTIHAPAGRPVLGTPPFTWEESAKDALEYEAVIKWKDWSLPGFLNFFEGFNGFGYRGVGPVPSPYLWGGTNHYVKGEFEADGHYNPEAVYRYLGVAALLHQLIDRNLILPPS